MGVEWTTFIIDPTGVIVRVFPRVKVAGHVEAALVVEPGPAGA